jgi:hypothetical protein
VDGVSLRAAVGATGNHRGVAVAVGTDLLLARAAATVRPLRQAAVVLAPLRQAAGMERPQRAVVGGANLRLGGLPVAAGSRPLPRECPRGSSPPTADR